MRHSPSLCLPDVHPCLHYVAKFRIVARQQSSSTQNGRAFLTRRLYKQLTHSTVVLCLRKPPSSHTQAVPFIIHHPPQRNATNSCNLQVGPAVFCGRRWSSSAAPSLGLLYQSLPGNPDGNGLPLYLKLDLETSRLESGNSRTPFLGVSRSTNFALPR